MNLRLLLKLYTRPLTAMSGIIDQGSLVFGILAVLAVSALLNIGVWARIAEADWAVQRAPARRATRAPQSMLVGFVLATSTLSGIFALALLYVPATLLAMVFLEPIGSFGVAFRRDYGPFLACALSSWAASHLPFGVLALVVPESLGGILAALILWAGGLTYFAVLMVCAARTVFGARTRNAVAAVLLGLLGYALEGFLPLLASPFLLYWGYQLFYGEIGAVTGAFGARQSFKRHLEAATLNPRDAGAHYQLGLIHQGRRQLAEAVERFQKAVEIDPGELDAHYQLGRIAREQKRYEDAIRHFEEVVRRDARYARYEIWREIGATYVESGTFEHARWALEKYTAQRTHDPEGLCLFGETLARLGEKDAARRQFESCIEAADTSPGYRRREVWRWRKRAEQSLAALGASPDKQART
jgi:tetratricopeptide (TPR) repeat protein